MAKKDPSDIIPAADTPAPPTPAGDSAAPAPAPPAGGSYTLDPDTGLLTCAVKSTQDRPPMRKVQDPATGAITKTVIQE